ncbi:MAG: lipoate--protein ligase family protein [Chlamydiae bacterium]|nr:lipoate--protein ligase family protein [Chlamydiota bacterium]
MTLHYLQLPSGTSIFDQLLLEEALLRDDTRNFCIVNEGSSPAIVMGISGKPHELVDTDKASALQIPIIKRFSGGGTVVVDESTLFVTFIFQKKDHPFQAYPEPIMKWSEGIYKSVFSSHPFALKENDYVMEEKKFGGNAQYIRKERWLHHTSFLWDYKKEKMEALLHPKKTPTYRAGREHESFLCKMKDFVPSKETFFSRLKESLQNSFALIEIQREDLEIGTPSRTSTILL